MNWALNGILGLAGVTEVVTKGGIQDMKEKMNMADRFDYFKSI